MGVDCRYSRLGFNASSEAAVAPAARLPKTDFAAANRNAAAIAKQAAEGIAPASPLRHSSLSAAMRTINRCGRGSHTVPIWANPGIRKSVNPRAILRVEAASTHKTARHNRLNNPHPHPLKLAH